MAVDVKLTQPGALLEVDRAHATAPVSATVAAVSLNVVQGHAVGVIVDGDAPAAPTAAAGVRHTAVGGNRAGP